MTRDEMKQQGISLSPKPKIKKRLWTNSRTGKVRNVPADLDPGWDHNPGKRRLDHLKQVKQEKIGQLTIAQQQANKVSDQAIKKAQQAYMTQLAANQALKKLGQSEIDGAFERQKKKTLERAAQHQLDTAISENTPYLANAIKQLNKQKGSAGLSSTELLAKAKTKATSIEQSVLLNQYKKAKVSDKQPSAKAQAAYDNLPGEAQLAIDDAIELKTGQYQAKATLKDIKDNPKGQTLKHQILQKLDKSENAENLTPVKLLQLVEEQYKLEQAKKEVAAKLSGYKKKVLEGKLPTPGQQAAFNSLDDAAKDKFLAKVDVAKKAAASEPVGTVTKKTKQPPSNPVEKTDPVPTTVEPQAKAPEWSNLTKIGNQKGSNPGGIYQDTTTGKKYYVKEPDSEDIARNEVLAAKLYEAAGVDVPTLHLMKEGKTVRIASEIIEDLQQDGSQLASGNIQGINDNFMVDAWLANWDVAGLGYDNLLIKGSKAIHIDVGGALRYRAQGGLKGQAFGKEVLEIESLRDLGMNPQSAAVFANVTKDDMVAGARRVLSLSSQQIEEMVETYGPTTKRERTRLVNTLVARQKYIAKQFPQAVQKKQAQPATSTPITRLEHEQIKNSRSNGYAIATDKGDIEDHNVLLYHKQSPEGKQQTGAYFKLMPAAMRKLERTLSQTQDSKQYDDLHGLIIKAVKSVAHRADNDMALEPHVFGYIDAAIERYEEIQKILTEDVAKKLRPNKDLTDFNKKTEPFISRLSQVRNDQVSGEIPTWDKTLGFYKKFTIKPAKSGAKTKGLQWQKKNTEYGLSSFDRGHQRHGKSKELVGTSHYETKVNGATIRFWPQGEYDVRFALQGRVEIEVPGNKQDDALKIFDAITELGIDSQRTSALDIEELYLDKLSYIHKQDKKLSNLTKGMDDQQERIDLKLSSLSETLELDLKNSPSYQPMGQHQAFGHGRRVHYRPEVLEDKAFKGFEKDYRIFHENTAEKNIVETLKNVLSSGGQMASTTDKIRRGIKLGGMSYSEDLYSGGANYFFTRIRKKNTAYEKEGFVWKSKQAARVDAISYSHDAYGRTADHYVQQHRKTDIRQLKAISKEPINLVSF